MAVTDPMQTVKWHITIFCRSDPCHFIMHQLKQYLNLQFQYHSRFHYPSQIYHFPTIFCIKQTVRLIYKSILLQLKYQVSLPQCNSYCTFFSFVFSYNLFYRLLEFSTMSISEESATEILQF